MELVFLYGPPGVGKLTVGTALSLLTGLKLFHSHLTIDCVRPIFDFGTSPFDDLVRALRLAVLERAAIQGVSLIFTYVYSSNPENVAQVEQFAAAVERHGGRVCFTRLFCDQEMNEQRIVSAEREARGKIHTVEDLHRFQSVRDLTSTIPSRESFEIDTTGILPKEAAAKIRDHFGLPTIHRKVS